MSSPKRTALCRHHNDILTTKLTHLLVAVLVSVSLPVGISSAQPIQIIADTDTTMPQFDLTFMNFIQLNGVDLDIDGSNIVFGACCTGGYYAHMGGSLRVIATVLDFFPGTENLMGMTLLDGSSATISGSNVVFIARDGQPGPGAVCALINDSFQVIAKSGVTRFPGTNVTIGTFFSLEGATPSISGENIAFVAASSAGQISIDGIYAHIDGQLITIADTDTDAPGGAGTFQNFLQLSGSSPTISGSNVAFVGSCATGGGVYASINGELRVIADANTPVPGGDNNFSNPLIVNARPSIDGENIAFNSEFPRGIYAYINGSLRKIADTNTPAPGSTGNFQLFGNLDGLNPQISGENVVFAGKAEGVIGVWAYIDGQLELVAGTDTPIPGHEPTTFDSFGVGVSPAISGRTVVFCGGETVPNEHSVFGIYSRTIQQEIPTTSTWGLTAMTLLIITAATIVLRQFIHWRRNRPAII